MQDLSKYEQLLDDNKPADVLAALAAYKGKEAQVFFVQAEARRMLGHFEQAIELYLKAIKFFEAQKPTSDEAPSARAAEKADMLLALAKCYRTLGDAKTAYGAAEKALKEAQKYPDLEDFKMLSVQEMGMALRAYGKLDEAEKLLLQVMAYYKRQKDIAGQGFIHWALGGICRLKGQFKQGIAHFNLSVQLARRAGDKISLAYGYCGLAGISRIAGDIKACVDNYKKAEKIFNNTQDIFGKAYTNCGMANGLRQLGKYDEALKRYVRADMLYSSINDTVDLGFVKWGKADVLKRKNKLKEAFVELKEAKKLFASSDEIRGQLLTEFALAQLMYALGDATGAVKVYDAALVRARKEGLFTYLESYT
jgi:tetratricopeptide (TPR) repeat protein